MTTTAVPIVQTPLLPLLVQTGELCLAGPAHALATQRRVLRQNKPKRFGSVALFEDLAIPEAIQNALLKQREMEQDGEDRQLLQTARKPLKPPLAVWLVTVLVCVVAHFEFGVPAGAND